MFVLSSAHKENIFPYISWSNLASNISEAQHKSSLAVDLLVFVSESLLFTIYRLINGSYLVV